MARLKLDMDQGEVALACMVTRSTYNCWEVGRFIPTMEKCHLLARKLNIPLMELLRVARPECAEIMATMHQ